MKKTIAYLPKRKQDDLLYFVKMILSKLPQTEMIILYGSYATGKYIDYDERIEFGVQTSYMSDYDILVVTHGIKDKDAGQKLDNIEDQYYQNPNTQTPVQFINDDIKKLNKDLEEGRYFYTQIKQEGVILYNSGNFKLARRRKLKYDEIRQQAQEYFYEKFQSANEFLENARFNYDKNWYKKAAFMLHQACENYYYALRLTFTLRNSKQHNLAKLSSSVRSYSPELVTVFPRDTAEEKRLFDLVKSAYVEARYNPAFLVTKEDIDFLVPKVESLRAITQRVCEERVKGYGEK